MQKNTKAKLAAGAVATFVAAGLAISGSSLTSAYFSDTNAGGVVSGTYGSIEVDVNGHKDKAPEFNLGQILPGEEKAKDFTFTNSGRSTQDVWLKFTNQTEVNQINTLGTYGKVTIKVDDDVVWTSDNLNTAVNPLPMELKLKADVKPTSTHKVDFSFTYAAKATGQLTEQKLAEAALISEPFAAELAENTRMKLRYAVVATQVGIHPNDPLNTPVK